MSKFARTLPIDTVNIILEYSGYHIFRNGKYMKRLSSNDSRCAVLSKLPLSTVIKYQWRSDERRCFVMLNIDNQKFYCLTKDVYYDYIECYLTYKIYPQSLNEKQVQKVKQNGYGALALGSGEHNIPDGFVLL